MVYVGIESSDCNVLKDINRFTINNDEQYKIIKKLKDNKIYVKSMFMFGNPDDNEETISKRYKIYLDKTLPILEYYKKLNLLHEIEGKDGIDQIFKKICHIIASLEAWLCKAYLYK